MSDLPLAIPMYCFQELSVAMPRCRITIPKDNVSYILDREGNKVGDINWEVAHISIYEGYEYAEEVIESIGKEKFTDARKEFSTETREDYEPLPGDVIDQVMNLYTEPKDQ